MAMTNFCIGVGQEEEIIRGNFSFSSTISFSIFLLLLPHEVTWVFISSSQDCFNFGIKCMRL